MPNEVTTQTRAGLASVPLPELELPSGEPAGCAGGEWLESEGRIESRSPADGALLGVLGRAGSHGYDRVIAEARRAAESWRLVPAPVRGECVRRIGEVLRANKGALGTLIALESGKIKAEADGEVQEMIDMADFAVGQSRMLYGRTLQSERPHHRMVEQWHPLGVVGVITAFNFPAAVWAWNAFLALITGNSVVWKPSPKGALTAVAIQAIANPILRDAGHPGVLSLFLTDEDSLAEHFVEDARVALVSFTGSSAVGRRVSAAVARRFGKCLLECSGNNAVIVDASANLPLALRAILFGAVGTAGQRCTTTRRLIVHESRYEELRARLVEAYSQVKVGHPLDSQTLMGPLIDEPARTRFRAAIAELKGLGAHILCGGETLPGPGHFVQPTLVEAQTHWDIVSRETFAPILYLMRCASLEEAIEINNAVPQGLASAVFTEDLRSAERFLSAQGSDCGIANVNIGTSGAEIGGAFGGEKETGGGREAGSDAWRSYMFRQTSTINWGPDLPLAQGIRFGA